MVFQIFFRIFAAEILKYRMKTFRDLKRDDFIVYKNFQIIEECDDIINGVHYTQKVTLVDVNCRVESISGDLREIIYDPNDEIEFLIEWEKNIENRHKK